MTEDDDHAFLSDEISDTIIGVARLEITMRSVIITVSVVSQDFPAGTSGGKWKIGVSGPENEMQATDLPTATFLLPAGDYTATAQRLDGIGADLGPLIESKFVVVDPLVPIEVANAIVVQIN